MIGWLLRQAVRGPKAAKGFYSALVVTIQVTAASCIECTYNRPPPKVVLFEKSPRNAEPISTQKNFGLGL